MMNQTPESAGKSMPFLDHINELRRRLIVSLVALGLATIVGFVLYNEYVPILIEPFGEQLYVSQLEQGFTTKIKVSIYLGLIISFPMHLYNGIAFIFPALTSKERNALILFLAGSSVLLFIGAYLAYFKILPLSIKFLKDGSFFPNHVTIWLDYKQSLTFVFQLLLSFLVLFQLPLVLLILMKFNLIQRAWLFRCSRYVIILIVIISALLTPPDIVSQLGLALPLILLFFSTMVVAKVFKFGE